MFHGFYFDCIALIGDITLNSDVYITSYSIKSNTH